MERRRWVAFPVLGMGALGMLAAHWADYALLARDPQSRIHLFYQQGHAYLPGAVSSAIFGAVLGALAAVLVGSSAYSAAPTFRRLFVRFAAAQVIAFTALEVIERVQLGLPPHHLLGAVLPIGIALQLVAAAAGAAIVVMLVRAGRAMADAAAGWRPVVVRFHIRPSIAPQPVPGDPRRLPGARGPPALLAP